MTITFTFKNGTGDKKLDRQCICSSKGFKYLQYEGVLLQHSIDKMPCTYSLSVKSRENLNISKCLHFDPNSCGKIPWQQLYDNGKFDSTSSAVPDQVYGEMGVGIAAQVTVTPRKIEDIEMSLLWDMPVVMFCGRMRKYSKFYTKYFGTSNNTLKIVDYIFQNYKSWENDIHAHQKKILNDP